MNEYVPGRIPQRAVSIVNNCERCRNTEVIYAPYDPFDAGSLWGYEHCPDCQPERARRAHEAGVRGGATWAREKA